MMTDEILIGICLLLLVSIVLLLIILFKKQPKSEVLNLDKLIRDEFREDREELSKASSGLRQEIINSQKSTSDTLITTIKVLGDNQKDKLMEFGDSVQQLSASNEHRIQKLTETIETKLKDFSKESEKKLDQVITSEKEISKDLIKNIKDLGNNQKEQLNLNEERIKELQNSIKDKLKNLQESNEKKLEEMRKTVDEKLHDTLEKRLGESFNVVNKQLEDVYKGLGEMKNLATGVGDLKRVLTNVQSRGTWGEVQLEELLSQILTPEQYDKNVAVREGTSQRVEFAIRLPGTNEIPVLWLPIDSKFPQEDYLRLVNAAERADEKEVSKCKRDLKNSIESSAKDIMEKYISPPYTTDFAIMFLPTEGLYAEVLRQPGLLEKLQQTHRVMVAGPTTLSALLNSLRLGFRTLAIEKRSSEVWQVLSAVKTEFGKFGEILIKVKKQLNTASNTLEQTSVRSRVMERKLKEVEKLPDNETKQLLELSDSMDATPSPIS